MQIFMRCGAYNCYIRISSHMNANNSRKDYNILFVNKISLSWKIFRNMRTKIELKSSRNNALKV